jgi:acyl carrier protein
MSETLTKRAVSERLVAIVRGHVEDHVPITAESTMAGDLGLDSLGLMEILAEIEDSFGIRVPDTALPELRTVGDVIATLERHLTEKGALSG